MMCGSRTDAPRCANCNGREGLRSTAELTQTTQPFRSSGMLATTPEETNQLGDEGAMYCNADCMWSNAFARRRSQGASGPSLKPKQPSASDAAGAAGGV